MCGRYVTKMLDDIHREFLVERGRWPLGDRYNVAPSQDVPVVRIAGGEREAAMMRWGLIPFFARGETPKYATINATIEKVGSGPAWRGPWKRGQRCILPASGFYEWHVGGDGRKQPFYITLADQEIFGFAGLWDRSVREDDTAVESCTIITLPANRLMSEIHNTKHRMPAILAREEREAWLTGTGDDARAALRPYPDDLMVAWKVSPRVNSPKNDDPTLIEPIQ